MFSLESDLNNIEQQAEAEVVPSSSLVEIEVGVEFEVGVEVEVEFGIGGEIGVEVEVGVGVWGGRCWGWAYFFGWRFGE